MATIIVAAGGTNFTRGIVSVPGITPEKIIGGVSNVIEKGDIFFCNFESVAATPEELKGLKKREKEYVFNSDPGFVRKFFETITGKKGTEAVVSLANNHLQDYGDEGAVKTIANLKTIGINICGAGMNSGEARMPAIIKVNRTGERVAFLSYSSAVFEKRDYAGEAKPGVAQTDIDSIKVDVAKARKDADFVVVSFHWGPHPAKATKEWIEKMKNHSLKQTALAHATIDAGADVIIGHGPHFVQKTEKYKKGMIIYSAGNFTGDFVDHKGALFEIELRKEGIEMKSYFIRNTIRPFLTKEETKEAPKALLR